MSVENRENNSLLTRIWAFLSVFGTGLISVLIWLIINGTQAADKLENLVIKVNDIQSTQKEMNNDLRGVHTVIDSIRFNQKLNQATQELKERHGK